MLAALSANSEAADSIAGKTAGPQPKREVSPADVPTALASAVYLDPSDFNLTISRSRLQLPVISLSGVALQTASLPVSASCMQSQHQQMLSNIVVATTVYSCPVAATVCSCPSSSCVNPLPVV
jgi:hypothetical protein